MDPTTQRYPDDGPEPTHAWFIRRLVPRPDWMDDAACSEVDPDLWYPDAAGDSGVQARGICVRSCPVLVECRAWAFEHESAGWGAHGVWGGLSTRQRKTAVKDGQVAARMEEARRIVRARRTFAELSRGAA